jgi:inorganic pyrophosphatase
MRACQSIELLFSQVSPGDAVPSEVNAIIRVPGQSTAVTYEGDCRHNILRVKRIASAGSRFWQNYGFVPGTLAQDGDPLDIVVLAPFPIERLSIVSCRPIGMLPVTYHAGPEEKIIAVVSDDVCASSAPVQRLDDLGAHALMQLKSFFENYCGRAEAGNVRCGEWEGVDAAARVILGAVKSFGDLASCVRR